MAPARRPRRTIEAERIETATGRTDAEPSQAATEHIDTDRPAHAWEFDEADSWEPVVPETWEVPTDEEQTEPASVDADSAGWTDAARSEEEWIDAAHSRSGQAAGEPGPPAENGTGPQPSPANPLRMALGLATMAAQRLRGGVPVGDGFVIGVGLVLQTANGLREVGRWALGPASRAANGALKGAAMLPVTGAPLRAAMRSERRIATAVDAARERGHETVELSRAEAEHLLRRGFGQTMGWTRKRVGHSVVDHLAARVADHVAARIAGHIPATGAVPGDATVRPAEPSESPTTPPPTTPSRATQRAPDVWLSDLSTVEHGTDQSTLDDAAGPGRRR
jgi:hypothetical protein